MAVRYSDARLLSSERSKKICIEGFLRAFDRGDSWDALSSQVKLNRLIKEIEGPSWSTVVGSPREVTSLYSSSPSPEKPSSEEGQVDSEEEVMSDTAEETTFQWLALKNGKAHVAIADSPDGSSCGEPRGAMAFPQPWPLRRAGVAIALVDALRASKNL